MRYLIAETNWDMVRLSHTLCTNGTLLTRTDRPEDIELFLDLTPVDMVLLEARDFASEFGRVVRTGPGQQPPVAVFASRPTPGQRAELLNKGADLVLDSRAPDEETLARLQAVARRCLGLARPVVQHGPLRIDLMLRRAHLGEVRLKLAPKIYELLEFIALRPGQLVRRERLLTHIYGFENEPDPKVFDVYICNLRNHLAASGGALAIETVRGAGYRFVTPDQSAGRLAA